MAKRVGKAPAAANAVGGYGGHNGEGMGGAPGLRPVIAWEKAVAVVEPRMATDAKHRKQRAQEAINSLLGKGHICFHNGWVWLP